MIPEHYEWKNELFKIFWAKRFIKFDDLEIINRVVKML